MAAKTVCSRFEVAIAFSQFGQNGEKLLAADDSFVFESFGDGGGVVSGLDAEHHLVRPQG